MNAIRKAIENDNITALAEMLSDADNPIDVDEFVFIFGDKMLHIAASEGSNDIVLYLLETHNADVDVRDGSQTTPLMLAARDGKMEVFKCLLEHGADINATDHYFGYSYTAMHYAASRNRKEMINFVLDNKDRFLPNLNLQNYDGVTPFHFACCYCSTSIIERMLHCGANVDLQDSVNWTALHYATLNKEHPKAVEMLANLGLDVNKRNKYGESPLHRARSLEIVRLLIDHGANLDAQNNDGETPLHVASESDVYYTSYEYCTKVVEMLLHFGSDANARNNRGNSPLHRINSVEKARLLIDHGANLDAQNNNGSIPEKAVSRQNVRYFLRLVRSFRETRRSWMLVFGLDNEERDQERANQEEGDNNIQEVEENRTAVKPFLLPKALHQLLGQPGNGDEQVMMGCVNVAFLGLRRNGPQAIEEHHRPDKKCVRKRKDPPRDPGMQERTNKS